MNQNELHNEYLNIEKKIFPILNFLENNKINNEYNSIYKGFITQFGPIVYNPEILFIGINPGDGAFTEYHRRGINITPVKVFSPEENVEFDWFKDGNARRANKKDWKAYKWFERNKSINNKFVANMIDLLYLVAEENCSISNSENEKPDWHKNFGQRIMFTNLYPIATENTNDLNSILNNLSKKKELSKYWEEARGNDKKINSWVVKKYFIYRIYELIKLTEPKIIVCLGLSSYNDFTCSSSSEKIIVNTEKKYGVDCPIIGFSRHWGWSSLIPEIAKEILKHSL